jgi:hypothetical protein
MVAPLMLFLASALAVTGCSGGSNAAHPSGAASTPSASPSAAVTSDPAAAAALERTSRVVRATRSFTFAATEILSGAASHATKVHGSVVRGQGVTYVLTANGRTSQVVRIAGATYVRPVPGHWSKLSKPRPVTDPAGTLLAVLRGLTQLSIRDAGGTRIVGGLLTSTAAKAAQLPVGPTPAQVAVTLDPAGHVTKLVVLTASGSTQITLTTTYGGFGKVKPLKPPV